MNRSRLLALAAALGGALLVLPHPGHAGPSRKVEAAAAAEAVGKVTRSDAEWKRILPAESYTVLRRKGTEIPYTGAYWKEHASGIYRCAGCGLALFSSATKFDSHTCWPSFWQPIAPSHVRTSGDTSHGMLRDEVLCARCGGHLGHVFDDGPPPTHLRYCMNSAALRLEKVK